MTDSEETLYTGYVYMIYNDVNDKVYIGETLQKITTRFKQHIQKAFDENRKYDGHLFRAIRKYGKEHFFVKEIDKVTGLDRNKVKEEIIEENKDGKEEDNKKVVEKKNYNWGIVLGISVVFVVLGIVLIINILKRRK